MHLLSLDLRHLDVFQFSDITRLEIEFDAVVQIILGTNGSGKTGLLRELTPRPSPRSSYGSEGYRRLTLRHQGSLYVLTSDYRNKTSPHSFVKDGVELNAGGTTQIQEELVVSELGYTDEVHALVTGSYQFSQMTAGIRRGLLMTLNPCQLGLVLHHHKQVSSAIRSCKANLAMLQERKLLLEQEMLPADQKQALLEERETLHRLVSVSVEFLHRADERLRGLAPTEAPTDHTDWLALRRKTLRRLPGLDRYHDVPRQAQEAYEANIHKTRALYQGRLASLEEQRVELMHLRNADHALLDELETSELEKQAQLQRQAKQDELADLKARSCGSPASEDILALWPSWASRVQDLCQVFLDADVSLVTEGMLQKRRQNFQHWQGVLRENQAELGRLRQEAGRVERLQIMTPSDIPDAPCAKMACPLYAQFHTTYQKRLDDLTRLRHQITRCERSCARLTSYLDKRAIQLHKQAGFVKQTQALVNLLRDLNIPISETLLTDLRRDPLILYHRAADWMHASAATHAARRLAEDLATTQRHTDAQTKLAENERTRLHQRVQAADAKYDILLARLAAGDRKLAEITQQLDLLTEYQTLATELQTQERQMLETLQQTWQHHDRQRIRAIITALTQKRDVAIQRLGEIDHVLQQQANIQTRHAEEVITQITKIETHRAELLWMEGALAKIPGSYQILFLNALIRTMNAAIAQVFSYPFALLPVSEATALDYVFPVRVGHITVPDISYCSDAQKEIVNLAFRLAMMTLLHLTEYPIQLDEIGKSFDTYHKQRLLDLVRDVVDGHVVSQLYLVNHHALIHEGLTQANVLVLREENILTPPSFNTHVQFNRALVD